MIDIPPLMHTHPEKLHDTPFTRRVINYLRITSVRIAAINWYTMARKDSRSGQQAAGLGGSRAVPKRGLKPVAKTKLSKQITKKYASIITNTTCEVLPVDLRPWRPWYNFVSHTFDCARVKLVLYLECTVSPSIRRHQYPWLAKHTSSIQSCNSLVSEAEDEREHPSTDDRATEAVPRAAGVREGAGGGSARSERAGAVHEPQREAAHRGQREDEAVL